MKLSLVQIKAFIAKNERVLSTGALILGFIIDSLTLRRIDFLIENLALLSYLLIAGVCIVILSRQKRFASENRVLLWAIPIAPLVLQLVFGALFSAFVVFYFRSAAISASWPFLIFLLVMLVGNEAFRPYYGRTVFHMTVFFLALISYCVLIVPVLTKSIGVFEFFGGVGISVLVLSLFTYILYLISPHEIRTNLHRIIQSAAITVLIFLTAYLTNSIPPVPLSLVDSAITHSLVRVGDRYQLSVEPRLWMSKMFVSETYHHTQGEPIYVWTSVFAPTKLSTAIVHNWEYRTVDGWESVNKVSFSILGGKDGGYRGYSLKENIYPGSWRVSVETEQGQVIGRVRFDVELGNPETLQTLVK